MRKANEKTLTMTRRREFGVEDREPRIRSKNSNPSSKHAIVILSGVEVLNMTGGGEWVIFEFGAYLEFVFCDLELRQ
jgi:hypothetical protein